MADRLAFSKNVVVVLGISAIYLWLAGRLVGFKTEQIWLVFFFQWFFIFFLCQPAGSSWLSLSSLFIGSFLIS